jgi:5-formyltetrahydrofolate cyclo-ligase
VGTLIPKGNNPDEVRALKARLRAELREMRRAVPEQDRLSVQICQAVAALDIWPETGATVMAYTAITGEPDLAQLLTWCAARGDRIIFPEQSPDPRDADIVILPGVAFSPSGTRLGQGGGWYDRFLEAARTDCVRVGVAFAAQIIDDLPLEAHDMAVHHVVTEQGRVGPDPAP